MNLRHLLAVQALEEEASNVVLGALDSVLSNATDVVFSTTAATDPPAEPKLSADDLSHIQSGWTVAVDGTILPWYQTVFDAGADAATEQVAAIREISTEIIGNGDPLLLNEAATRHLAAARNRFLAVGQETWNLARSEMLAGFAAGEGIDPIRIRLQEVVDLSKARAEAVARTEVISASNAGAITRIRAMGADAPKYKQWLATNDRRTRPTHRAANNQVVPLGAKFQVGATSLDYPGDPNGMDEEVINCRCAPIFTDSAEPEIVDEDITEEVANLVAASAHLLAQALVDPRGIDHTTGEPHTGSMIALVPAEPEALAVRDGEPQEQLHVTLWFLGEADDQPIEFQHRLLQQVRDVAARLLPVPGQVFGAAVWNPTGDHPCAVLNVGGPGLEDLREAVRLGVEIAALETAAAGGDLFEMPDNHTPWAAHMCVGYSDDPVSLLPEALATVGPVLLDTVRLTFGAEVHDFPMGRNVVVDISSSDSALAQVNFGDPEDNTEDNMPFGIRRGGIDCPFEVYNKDTDERVEGGCHETREDAVDHQQALQVNVEDADAATYTLRRASDGAFLVNVQGRDLRGAGGVVADALDQTLAQRRAAAGDCPPGHHKMPNGECMPDEEMTDPLAAQPGEHFHAVMHTQNVSTGLRTFSNLSWRTPPFAYHWQRSSSAHGGLPETVQVGLVTRVMADPDNPDVLHAWGPLDLGGDVGREYGRQLVGGFARWVSIGLDEQPVKETIIWPDDGDEDAEDDFSKLFDQPEQVLIDGGRIGELSGVSVPAQDDATVEPTPELIALMNGDEDAEAATDPEPAEAVTAASTTEEPMRPTMADVVQGLTAAAHRIEIPHIPPRWWFDEPTDVEVAGALYVTDEGRIYGALAPLGVNHRAYSQAGQRREVPFGNVDYDRFMGGVAITQEGRIAAGPVTMDCSHASMFRTDHEQAPAHYDNACTVVAKIRVGESKERGIVWVAGALEPAVTVDQVSRMLACRLSGDWQTHSDRAGWQELVAALLVPSPGFPMAHGGARVDVDDGVLVASSVPVHAVGKSGRPRIRINVAARTVDRLSPVTRKEQVAAVINRVKGA